MAKVELRDIWKRFGDVIAVSDVNLTIADEEFLVLLGPSGCGKSTTLRMIAGLEEISQGEIAIGGRVVNNVAPKDRDIAMVFQNYALYPHMTVRQNLAFSLKLRRQPRKLIDERVEKAAEILGISSLLDRKPKQLSGGQRQRVAMGRAIVREPRVFLFDEPLSNLDAKLRVQMRLEIARLHRELNATIIYVTHDQVEAMTLADRIVIMKDGKVHQVGAPLDVYERPINTFVASFIGSPSMNLVEATIHPEKPVVEGDGFSLPLSPDQHHHVLDVVDDWDDAVKVMLGIRPQHLKPTTDDGVPGLTGTVDVVEPMGPEAFVYFRLGDKQMIARTEKTPPDEGREQDFSVEMSKIHLFSHDGEQRLNYG